jgi:hypothetical protein
MSARREVAAPAVGQCRLTTISTRRFAERPSAVSF